MSNSAAYTNDADHRTDHRTTRRVSTETKASFKTTELIAYVVAVLGVLIASAVADEASDFGTQEAWFYITPAHHRLHDQPRPRQVRQPRLLRRHRRQQPLTQDKPPPRSPTDCAGTGRCLRRVVGDALPIRAQLSSPSLSTDFRSRDCTLRGRPVRRTWDPCSHRGVDSRGAAPSDGRCGFPRHPARVGRHQCRSQ